ncbi:Uncharacterised protein [Mycobacteroides abscessus subsp. abscessus]|nr:Uncharacterised protein [Mycobacteroides abscessus subsp. abscessus]
MRTVSSGVTVIGSGTASIRSKAPGSSGESARPLLQRTRSGASKQPLRPGNSWPRSQPSTVPSAGVGGSTVW